MKTKILFGSKVGLLLLCLIAFSFTGCQEAAIEQPAEFGQAPTEEPAFGTIKMDGKDGVKAPSK